MSTGNPRRTRSDLVAGLKLPPGKAKRLLKYFRRGDVMVRVSLALGAALAMWATTLAWAPRLPFRSGFTPGRDIVARTSFSVEDKEETERLKRQARRQASCVYQHDKQPLVEFRQALKDSIIQMTSAESFEQLGSSDQEVWKQFLVPKDESNGQNEEQLFNDLHEALAEDSEAALFEKAVQAATSDFERHGLLVNLQHKLEEGSQTSIQVHDVGKEVFLHSVEVKYVRIAEVMADLRQKLAREFESVGLPGKHLQTLSQLTFSWISNKRLPPTLSLNEPATQLARDDAAAAVEAATREYQPGERLAPRGFPLAKDAFELLKIEHRERIQQMTFTEMLGRSLADIGMYIAMYVLCGSYIFFHHRPMLSDLRQLATMLGLVVATVTASMITANDPWRSEMIPLMMFGTTVVIVYRRELALLLSAAVALVVAVSTGQSLAEFIILVSAISASILLLGRVRSRTKLIYVGLGAGIVAALTTIGVGTLMGQSYGWSGLTQTHDALDAMLLGSFMLRLVVGALWFCMCTVLAGVLMTGLLPFIERLFDVQTDISLLELGDAAHPLLQELVRRAPGTYNHSITVASIAEAAAEAIGANSLLVRVGAYFHDIGKMLKPGYFIENQGNAANRHDSLMPAMSTLVIIAHVKDGADLARQHHLPRSIMDFIEQHHGTTLVEYFYQEATKRHEQNPDSSDVDETSFRYPGPKPQTKETGVLMMADGAESICRTLVDPAPARIEHVVQELAMKRLLDGQFDDCGLTLRELRVIEDSLVKSLTAVYHGRVKYPSQQTA